MEINNNSNNKNENFKKINKNDKDDEVISNDLNSSEILSSENYGKLEISVSKDNEEIIHINEFEYDHNSDKFKKIIISIKILYFLSGFTSSSWGRLAPIFFTLKDITPLQMGIIDTTSLFIKFMSNSFWGYISDKIRNKKKIFLFCNLMGTLTICLYSSDYITKHGFWIIFFISCLKSLFSQGSEVLTSYALEVLGKKSELFGQLRVYFAVSWGFGNLLFIVIYHLFKDFRINFAIYFCLNFLYMYLIKILLPDKTLKEEKIKSSDINMIDLWEMLKNKQMILYILEFGFFMIGFSFIENLLYQYVLKELKGSILLTGFMILFSVIPEIPIYQNSEYFLKKFSYFQRISMSLFAFILRMIGYGILTNNSQFLILLFEPMHGLSWVLFDISKAQIVKEFTPDGLITSSVAVINLLSMQIPKSLGYVIGGYIMENYSGKILYIGTGIAFSILLISKLVYKLIYKNG